MARIISTALLSLAIGVAGVLVACGGGDGAEKPGERITDPARVPSSTPIQNPTLYKIQGNEVILTGGSSGAITPVAATPAPATEYTIKSGDFCSTIATANKITLDELQKANRNMDCNNLKIGEKIKIPAAPVAATPTRGGSLTGNPTARPGTSGSKSYTVVAGDTCGGIAASHGVTLQALLAANNTIDANCTNLKLGQVVTIP